MVQEKKADQNLNMAFTFLNEVFIIQQLASTLFNKVMPDGLHVSHFAMITHLIKQGDAVPPAEIAKAMQVTRATMSHTLNVLGKKGLIEVRTNPSDSRSKLVYLTEDAHVFQQKAIAALAPYLCKISKEFEGGELEKHLPFLIELRTFLDNERNPA